MHLLPMAPEVVLATKSPMLPLCTLPNTNMADIWPLLFVYSLPMPFRSFSVENLICHLQFGSKPHSRCLLCVLRCFWRSRGRSNSLWPQFSYSRAYLQGGGSSCGGDVTDTGLHLVPGFHATIVMGGVVMEKLVVGIAGWVPLSFVGGGRDRRRWCWMRTIGYREFGVGGPPDLRVKCHIGVGGGVCSCVVPCRPLPRRSCSPS